MNYQIVSDGSCDLPQELTAKQGITVVPFYVSFDDATYQKEMVDIGVRTFYDRMVEEPQVYPKSSMPTAPDFMAAFEPIVARGDAVLCLCITKKFSGSMQAALLAKNMVTEKYPDAVITVMDTTVNTVLQGIFVLEAVRLRQAGIGYDEAIDRLENIRASGRIFFTIGSIDYLQHGGRIGKVAGRVVTILNVKPMITLKDGEIFSSGVARSRKASMEKVLSMVKAYLQETGKPISAYSVCIGYGYSRDEAKEFKKMLMQALGLKSEELPLYQIGATIAVHTGPYPIGVGMVEKAL